jgi:hypothetical protein
LGQEQEWEKIQDFLISEEIKAFGIIIPHIEESLIFMIVQILIFYNDNQIYFGAFMVLD